MSGRKVAIFACFALIIGMLLGILAFETGRWFSENTAKTHASVMVSSDSKAETQ